MSFSALERWYASQCNGEWERSYGVWIDSLDNPGWQVRISLRETLRENAILDKVKLDRSNKNWIHYWIDEHVFHIACGPANLSEALGIFVQWFEADSR